MQMRAMLRCGCSSISKTYQRAVRDLLTARVPDTTTSTVANLA